MNLKSKIALAKQKLPPEECKVLYVGQLLFSGFCAQPFHPEDLYVFRMIHLERIGSAD